MPQSDAPHKLSRLSLLTWDFISLSFNLSKWTTKNDLKTSDTLLYSIQHCAFTFLQILRITILWKTRDNRLSTEPQSRSSILVSTLSRIPQKRTLRLYVRYIYIFLVTIYYMKIYQLPQSRIFSTNEKSWASTMQYWFFHAKLCNGSFVRFIRTLQTHIEVILPQVKSKSSLYMNPLAIFAYDPICSHRASYIHNKLTPKSTHVKN